ncbi:sugar ABC transporter permease [Thermanaerothrix sp. 4228-RoL]|uniref:Sugar ABC transporter permease n=1 Tax=Thermanaerothrix solaris TaxID=3058434 RepID=A0ABU3NRK4_9CHLR|nr:sugar ABC transporter permease [Thermanaerothrix sp. 4228-RoL]MDT8899442.1 sugar ABC transporter permease [Thermanaerothrix sp. 4228-RoL]
MNLRIRTHPYRRDEVSTALIALLPAIIVFGVFNIIPLGYTAYLSLLKWDGFSIERQFVGFQNFLELLSSTYLWNSLKATIYYTLGVIGLSLPFGLLVAILLNSGLKGQVAFRTLYFLPVVTSTVAASMVWKLMLDPGSGYINVILREIGFSPPAWLRDTHWAMPAVILLGVWKRIGFNMVIYLAGLQSIPREYYEAARVDGATSLAQIRYITIPLLAPTTALLIVMAMIDSFLLFDQVFVLTGGGPAGATDVIGFLLYRYAFRYFDLGKASAIAWIMFIFIASVTLIQWRLSRFGTKEIA